MFVLVSVGLAIEIVKWISPILNGDNVIGIVIVKAVFFNNLCIGCLFRFIKTKHFAF